MMTTDHTATTPINLQELLLGDMNRLRYLRRFGNSLVLHRENVAEHSYYVSLYGYWLCQWVKANTATPIETERVLVRAIFHDGDESRTGDFQRPFKYSSPELKTMLDAAAKGEFQRAVTGILVGADDLVARLTEAWENAKDGSPEGCIVALADYLSVLSHMWQEVACANGTMLQHYDTMVAYLRTFDAPQFDFLRPVIRQVDRIVSRVFDTKGNDLRTRFAVPPEVMYD